MSGLAMFVVSKRALAGSVPGQSRCADPRPQSGEASAAIRLRTSGRSVTATAKSAAPDHGVVEPGPERREREAADGQVGVGADQLRA